MAVTTSSAVKQRYKEEQRQSRMKTNGYNERYYPDEDEQYYPPQRYYDDQDRYNPYDNRYQEPRRSTNGRGKIQKPVQRPPVSLTQLVIDWWFCTNENGENIYIPIFTDLFYSERFGGRNNILTFDMWNDMGMNVSVDAIDYRGKIYKRYHKMINELVSQEDGARKELLDAITQCYAPPPVTPLRKRYNWFKWMFLGLLVMNLIVGFFAIRGVS